ncbi:carboxyl-terminal processing protease [Kordia periserrulae]|uniref:Carboxyl-terminal processing protease n=1 Tax=Kordia periserrulae TaxID=701523 RepID=A0A2T6C310_9FLAO|nr:S41 family peptidase [Kordia periserrulae]PTX62712.1 carboxyl-terminal processing protease [Kordia periserrulae]
MHTIFRFLLLFVATSTFAQIDSSFCTKSRLVLTMLEEHHYKPKTIDDAFSNYVFNTLLERLDSRRLLYSKAAIESLAPLKDKLDDYLLNGECDFINEFTAFYEKHLKQTKETIEQLEKATLDFSGKDSVYYGNFKEKSTFSKTQKTLQKRWSKKIRIDMIRDYLSLSEPSNFPKIKAQLKQKVISENKCFIVDKLQVVNGLQAHVETTFLDVVCSYFDPHSSFFDPTDNTNFMNSIGTETSSIGVWFSKNSDGKIVVAGLQTGSTAWKEKEINAGDLVLSLEANDTEINTTCLSLVSLYDFINEENHKTITIHFLTDKNLNKTVVLRKENLKIEENAVNSFILKGKQNIGYISLPSFYTNMDFGFGSANDIAKELFKLNAVDIDGLILDLRGNGGGSMKQAIDLAGMFIDKGPIGIYRDQKNNKTIVKDLNRGTLFTKPLVILINHESASASEFIAAALRDHNRAIIVGSKTYGKGTIQQIMPLQSEEGFLRITIEKMYGFKGNSHQAIGIVPDIEFPSLLTGIEDGESENPNVIVSDTIQKNVYFKIPEAANYDDLRARSFARLQKNKASLTIQEINKNLLSYLQSEREMPLTVKGIEDDLNRFNAIFEKSDAIEMEHDTFEVVNLEDYKEILAYNKNKAKENSYAIKSIQTDHEIEETYRILSDYIQQLSK